MTLELWRQAVQGSILSNAYEKKLWEERLLAFNELHLGRAACCASWSWDAAAMSICGLGSES